MSEKEELLTIIEVRRTLKCGDSTVRRLINDRKLEACKIRGGIRIFASSLQAYVRAEILRFQIDHGLAEYPIDEKDFQI